MLANERRYRRLTDRRVLENARKDVPAQDVKYDISSIEKAGNPWWSMVCCINWSILIHLVDSFKIQAHAMLLDTSFNSLTTVWSNLYNSFTETATKMWTYARCLPLRKQPSSKLVIRESFLDCIFEMVLTVAETITNLIDLAFVLLKSKGNNRGNEGYKCAVSKTQVEW